MIDDRWANKDYLQEIEEKLKNTRIKCFKYNYNIDSSIQNFDHQHGFIELTKDGESLRIFNLQFQDKMADFNLTSTATSASDDIVMPEENENILLNYKESSASCRID